MYLQCVARSMLLEHKFVSAPYYIDTVDGMQVSLHVTWAVLTTGGTMIL